MAATKVAITRRACEFLTVTVTRRRDVALRRKPAIKQLFLCDLRASAVPLIAGNADTAEARRSQREMINADPVPLIPWNACNRL